jgi:hypothetical protein
MSSVSAVVAAGGRVFYILDEASRLSILIPPKWSLIARDAFNGTVLWERRLGTWHTHLWPLKSGPAQLPRRLVAEGDRVYVTLSLDAPLTALDTATGETIRTYEGSKATEEIILSEGVLFLLVNSRAKEPEFANLKRIGPAAKSYGPANSGYYPSRSRPIAGESSFTMAKALSAWTVTRVQNSGGPIRSPEPIQSVRSMRQSWSCTRMWSCSQAERLRASRQALGIQAAKTQ